MQRVSSTQKSCGEDGSLHNLSPLGVSQAGAQQELRSGDSTGRCGGKEPRQAEVSLPASLSSPLNPGLPPIPDLISGCLSLGRAFSGALRDPPGQEKKADQRAGALTRESERLSLSVSWRGPARDRMSGSPGPGAGEGAVSGETKSWCIHCGQKEGLGEGVRLLSPAALAGGFRQRLGTCGSGSSQGQKRPKVGGICIPTGWGPRLLTARRRPGSRAGEGAVK